MRTSWIKLLTVLTLCSASALGGCATDDADTSDDPGLSDLEANTGSISQALTFDGVAPQTSSCWGDRRFVQSTHLFIGGNGQSVDTIIYLYYSPSCRTTWARLTGGTIAVPNDNNGGSASITRNSDGRAFSCKVTSISGECITAMVNDAGVTSYAFGFEDGGAFTAWARTANF